MYRALRDWPTGRVTPRLRRVVCRCARCAGGLCACFAAAGAAVSLH